MRSRIAAVAFGLIASCLSLSVKAQDTEFRVGALGTFTGPFGVLGESMRRGAELAALQRGNKVLGVPIRFNWEDDETKPQVAVQKATMMVSDKVHMLFAPVSSGSSLAVAKLAEREKVPFLITLSTLDDLTGKAGNPYTFRTSNSNDMEVRMLAKFVEAKKYKKIFIAASDYKVGRDSVASLTEQFKAIGVSVIAEEFLPLGAKDYSVVINKIAQSDADAVYLGFSGNDLISLLKQAEQFKLQERKPLFGQIVMDESLGKAVGPAGLGVYSAMRYHFSTENDANKAFVAAYRAKYNEYPDQYAGEAYDGLSWFLDVIDKTGSWDKEKWVAAFSGSDRPNSVEGHKTMRACDRQAAQPGFYGEAVKGDGDLPPITMKILYRFTPDELFSPCK